MRLMMTGLPLLIAANAGCVFPGGSRLRAALIAAPRLLPIADRLPRR